MNKVKLILDVAQHMLKVAEDLRSLSDSVQAICTIVTEGLSEEPKAMDLPEKKEKGETGREERNVTKGVNLINLSPYGYASPKMSWPCLSLFYQKLTFKT